jgi:hypothetical protein
MHPTRRLQMRRDPITIAAAALLGLLVVVSLSGCGQGSQANQALAAGNAKLAAYDELAVQTSRLLVQLQTVQPTVSSVKRGLQLLDLLDRNLDARDKAAAAAKAEFQRIKGMQVKTVVIGYADRAIAYTESLVAMDDQLAKLSTDYRNLFDQVSKRGADALAVQSLTAKIDAQIKVVDAQRAKTQTLLDAVDKYYQENLAGGK